MDACYVAIAVALCLLLYAHVVNAQEALLSVEAWVIIGLIGGVIVIIIGLIWIVFCIMLYRHHKEHHYDDEDSNKEKKKKDNQQKKKQKQRREQQREVESAIQNTEVHDVYSSPLENEMAGDATQSPRPMSPHTQSPLVPESAHHTEETNTAEPSNINPSSSALFPPPKPSVPSTLESLFTPPALTTTEEGGSHGRKQRVQLSNVSSSRLRKLSDVEECEVQPEVSNFPLRYCQRRSSNASRKISSDSDPFSFFNFEPSLLGRSPFEKRDTHSGLINMERNSRNYQDHVFGQLNSWPEFN